MAWANFVQNLLDGLLPGAGYAMLAVGFTLIFGVLRRANLAYGPAIMLGAYAATWLWLSTSAGLLILLLVTVAVSVLAGAYVERLCFAPHRRGSAVAAMVASFALWMQLEEVATLWMPKHLYAFPPLTEAPGLLIAGFELRRETLVLLAVAVLMFAALAGLLYRTRFGLGVRALVEQPVAAELVGIRSGRLYAGVFAVASVLGGVAAFLIAASFQQVTPHLGMWSTMKGMLAMMIGGLGSLPGAVLGGLVLGQIETHGQWYLGPQFRDLAAYLLLFALLALRRQQHQSWGTAWTSTRSAS
ncbi:MAG: branched-chain amino acid ABC transporter permease [Burkholderiales bacterium]|nr:MAG: branched-chain amino acid ABC transporter permease [Burkholderiales bacterium]